MSGISTNMVQDGITLALRSAWPQSQIGVGAIEQGLMPPAFIVCLLTAGQMARLGERFRRRLRFTVAYFPEAETEPAVSDECCAVADRLYTVLEFIELSGGDKLRGTDMSFEMTDGVLHFFVSYNHFVRHKKEKTLMEELKVTKRVKC